MTAQIEDWAGISNLSVTRIMPNTPLSIGEGASGVFHNAHVKVDQKNTVNTLVSAGCNAPV